MRWLLLAVVLCGCGKEIQGGAGSAIINDVMAEELEKLLQKAKANGESPERIKVIEERLSEVR